MLYQSTRGSKPVSAAEAIIAGLAPNGGLYLPQNFPVFTEEEIQTLCQLTYNERAAKVMAKFLSGYTESELADVCGKAYSYVKFPVKGTAPVVELHEDVSILELFHGPTCAFKDFALQVMPYLLMAALKKCGVRKEVVILVATSGDTGKAALTGFSDVPGTRICVFYPAGGVSPIQELQMVSQEGSNVMVFGVNGNFDDAQTGVKQIFTDTALVNSLGEQGFLLSSANSINWGRMVPQVVYYFSAYCDLLNANKITMGSPVDFIVPTGNFGNIFSAYLAKQCGLPIGTLVCASNKNKVLTDFFNTGTYDRRRDFYLTSSPAMDILISSNLERLLYLLLSRDPNELASLMNMLSSNGVYTVDDSIKRMLKKVFFAGFADDAATDETIRRVFETTGYLCDTHTAVALNVFEQYKNVTQSKNHAVIASTANPFKFGKSVLQAIEGSVKGSEFEQFDRLCKRSGVKAPESLTSLQTAKVRFRTMLEKDGMKQAVAEWLNQKQGVFA